MDYELMQKQAIAPAAAPEEADVARAIAEVQAQVIMAKRYPRDEITAYARIMKACERKSLAEVARYTYPRAGQAIEGPSIRLAEVIARSWGNLQYGFRELGRGAGISDVEAYCWDLETNVRVSRSLQVAHTRDKKTGKVKLSADRDVYEHIASQAQRRVRACILEVIPGDIVEAAERKCLETLTRGMADEPMEDRIRKMVVAFDSLGVSKEMIEDRLHHKVEACTVQELVNLRSIYNSLRDGVAAREDFFKLEKKSPKASSIDEKLMETEPESVSEPKEPAQPEYVCKKCGFIAKSERGLKKHITQAHKNDKPEEPEQLPEIEVRDPEDVDYWENFDNRTEDLRLLYAEAELEDKFYELLKKITGKEACILVTDKKAAQRFMKAASEMAAELNLFE